MFGERKRLVCGKKGKYFVSRGEEKRGTKSKKKVLEFAIQNSHLPLQFFHCPKSWQALLISIAVGHVTENIVVQHRRHQTPSSERQVEVVKALDLLPVHSSVRVLVSRVHKRLEDHPVILFSMTYVERFVTLEMC